MIRLLPTQRRLLPTDPRAAHTLDEACANGDGTYNGFRLLSWLTEAVAPGRGASEEQVRATYAEVMARRGK